MNIIDQNRIGTIVKGLHVLYTGTNGRKTFGVIVQTLNWDPKSGYSERWPMNDWTLKQPAAQHALGLTSDEYQKPMTELSELEKQNELPTV